MKILILGLALILSWSMLSQLSLSVGDLPFTLSIPLIILWFSLPLFHPRLWPNLFVAAGLLRELFTLQPFGYALLALLLSSACYCLLKAKLVRDQSYLYDALSVFVALLLDSLIIHLRFLTLAKPFILSMILSSLLSTLLFLLLRFVAETVGNKSRAQLKINVKPE